MANKTRITMSDEDMQNHRKQQALERERRGLVGFTRPEVREAVMGRTAGESKLGSGQRGSQVTYPKRKR